MDNEYKITYKVKELFMIPQAMVDVVSAPSAKEALEKWKQETSIRGAILEVDIAKIKVI